MKTRNALLILLSAVSALLFPFTSSDAQSIKEMENRILAAGDDLDGYFARVLTERNFVALGACLIKDGKIIWQNSYGYQDLELKKPCKPHNIYQLASLSKVITATALMQLYENGLFSLDDDVSQYLPFAVRNPNFPDKKITFRMLLTHTAGFTDITQSGNKISLGVRGDPVISLNDFVEGLFIPGGKYYSADYFSTDEPGTKYEYSNISFSLLGYLLEKITKKDFAEYCKENIFRPMGMNNTGWFLRELDTSRIVFGYGFPASDTSFSYKKIRHFGVPGYPEGMLRTTMEDFSRFLLAFMNRGRYNEYQMLRPETVSLMLSPQGIKNIPSRTFPVKDIGITWLINDIEGEDYFSMNGFSGSIFTNAYFSPDKHTGIIYYFTGISMKNMPAVIEITRKLKSSLIYNF